MALITRFRFRNDRTISFRTRVDCGWTYDQSGRGPQILQLETYASDGTTSQVLQLDRQRVRELLTIIDQVFPDLRAGG